MSTWRPGRRHLCTPFLEGFRGKSVTPARPADASRTVLPGRSADGEGGGHPGLGWMSGDRWVPGRTGRGAWGGAHERLPRNLRVASAVAAVVWVLAALLVLAGAGIHASPIPTSVADRATWILAGLLVVGAAMNLMSRSRPEQIIWGPVALVLAALTAVVASAG
jgi:hypothetical protein